MRGSELIEVRTRRPWSMNLQGLQKWTGMADVSG